MQKEAEISALFKLIDDPDEEVFNTIADRLLNYGTPIIPDLEHLWENTLDEATLERIEIMIYKLRLQDLKEAFIEWKSKPDPSLFEGALLVTKFQFPELAIDSLRHQMEKIRRNIWLELNNYLTPLEQANVIRNILFNYYQIKGVEVNYEKPEEFLIAAPLQSKKEMRLPTPYYTPSFVNNWKYRLSLSISLSNVSLLFMHLTGTLKNWSLTHKNLFSFM